MPYINSGRFIVEDEDVVVVYDTKDTYPGNIWWQEVKHRGCLLYLPTGASSWNEVHRKDFALCTRDEIIKATRSAKRHCFFFFEDRDDIPQYFDDLKTKFDLHHLNAANQIWFILQGVHTIRMQKKSLRKSIFKQRNLDTAVWALNNLFNKKSYGTELNFAMKEMTIRYLFFFCDEDEDSVPTGLFDFPNY